MKPRIWTLLAALLLVVAWLPASAQSITVIYNGTVLAADPAPVEQSGRVLIGMRDIFEAMNASIQWDSATRTVTATQGATVVVLTIGSNVAYVSGRARAATVLAYTYCILMKISATLLDKSSESMQLLFTKNFAKTLVKRISKVAK